MSLYYRNRRDVISLEGIEVDAGSLWKWQSDRNLLVLQDEDQDITAQLNEDFENSL